MSRGNNMTIDIKALRKQLPSFDFIVYTNRTELEPVEDGDYVLAADAHERLEAAADRIEALEAENKRLRDQQALLPVTHDEAREILSRFNNSRFRNHNIPVNPECDVALRLGPYIDQCEASADRLAELEEQLHLANIDALQTEAERAALEAENKRLRESLSDYYHQHRCGCGHPACRQCGRDKEAFDTLSQPAERPPLMIRCQVCEHHTPVTGEACAAVAMHVLQHGDPVVVSENGTPRFRITVEDLAAQREGE